MAQTLEGIDGVSCTLDDMIITGRDDQEHLDHLKKSSYEVKREWS